MDKIELQKLTNEHKPFTTKLNDLMEDLLSDSNVKYHLIEHRTKTIESLEKKIADKNIKNIREDIMDISGIRIILYYQEDVNKVVDLVKNNFTIDEKNSMDKANLYNSNEFGYLSVHYIVTLDNKRNKLPEWKNFSKLKAEIQIRTVLQHSWASMSHGLIYKNKYGIPKELERKLYRLAGLFELADEQFLKIKEEHNSLNERMKNKTTPEKIENIEINLLTLKYAFEKESSISNTIEKIALEAGFENSKNNREERNNRNLSHIALISDMLRYKFVNEIEENLQLKVKDLKLYFIELTKDTTLPWLGNKEFYLLLSMLFLLNIKQLEEFSVKSRWNNSYFLHVKKTIISMKKL